jgi:hypothetical protein
MFGLGLRVPEQVTLESASSANACFQVAAIAFAPFHAGILVGIGMALDLGVGGLSNSP